MKPTGLQRGIAAVVVLLLVAGTLGCGLWATPTPIVIVATLTPTPPPQGGPTPTPEEAPAPAPTPTPQDEEAPVPTNTPAGEAAPPPPPGKVIGDIDADMKAHLQEIMQTGQAKGRRINVFAKVGDSITESMAFLYDLGYGWENLGEYTNLSGIVEYYREVTVDTMDGEEHNSFNRQSLCGVSGDCAGAPLEGGRNSTLYSEFDEINPGVAIIMYGTNDIALSDLGTYRRDMNAIIDVCEEEGVIPILSTIPDRLDGSREGELALEYNDAIRSIARERNVPLLDYWLALQPLPNKGIDDDGIHPNAYKPGEFYEACNFSEEGLQYGFNVRNKTALEMLLKLKQVVIDDGPPDTGEPGESTAPTPSARPTGAEAPPPEAEALPPPAPGGVRPLPDTTDGIYVFNDQLSGWSLSDEQFRFSATHYVGTQKMIRDHTRRLRQYNPDFVVLHYRLGLGLGYRAPGPGCEPTGEWLEIVTGNDWEREWPGDDVVQENWFFPWSQPPGAYNCDWGWYVMELDDPGWREWWSGQVLAQIEATESDGLFADSFNVPSYIGADHYNPPLPDFDAAFEESWTRRIEEFTAYAKGRFGTRYFIPNVGEWVTTRDTTDYSGADGVMVEGFSEWGPHDPFELEDWRLQMNRVLGLTRQGKAVIAQSYIFEPDDVETRMFYLGNYLLVKGRHSYINVDYGMEPEYFPEYDIDLGPPVDDLPGEIDGLFSADWGLYARRYENGLVLVNPGADAVVADLGGTYYLAEPVGGGIVPEDGDISAWSVGYGAVERVELGPNRAAVLLVSAP